MPRAVVATLLLGLSLGPWLGACGEDTTGRVVTRGTCPPSGEFVASTIEVDTGQKQLVIIPETGLLLEVAEDGSFEAPFAAADGTVLITAGRVMSDDELLEVQPPTPYTIVLPELAAEVPAFACVETPTGFQLVSPNARYDIDRDGTLEPAVVAINFRPAITP